MERAQYIEALENVNFRDMKSISSFMYKTQIRDWDPYPKPIILGSELGNESGAIYQLRSQIVDDFEPMSDLDDRTAPSDAIVEIRFNNLTKRYVFPLGILEASLPPGPSLSGFPPSKPVIESATAIRQTFLTPYRVCISPVNRSISLVLPDSPLSVSTDDLSGGIPLDADTWPYIPTKTNGRSSFHVIQVATWSEFTSLSQSTAVSRQIFSEQALKKAKREPPKLFVPAAPALQKAMTSWDRKKAKEKKPRSPIMKAFGLATYPLTLVKSKPFSKRVHEAEGASKPQPEVTTERGSDTSPFPVIEPSSRLVPPV